MDTVVNAIKSSGIPANDIRTSGVTLEPVYNYNSEPQGATDKPKIVGYRATNTVTVKVKDLSKIGSTIDAANNAGANRVNGVSFELSDELAADMYKQALTKAVSDGSDKAKTISSAAGVSNLTLKSISESGTYYPQPAFVEFGGASPVSVCGYHLYACLCGRTKGTGYSLDDIQYWIGSSIRFFIVATPSVRSQR